LYSFIFCKIIKLYYYEYFIHALNIGNISHLDLGLLSTSWLLNFKFLAFLKYQKYFILSLNFPSWNSLIYDFWKPWQNLILHSRYQSYWPMIWSRIKGNRKSIRYQKACLECTFEPSLLWNVVFVSSLNSLGDSIFSLN